MKLNLKKASPLKRAVNTCNKTTITVCKNSMQLRWGMEIRINDSTFPGFPDGVFIEYISYDGDPNVSTATIRLSEMIAGYISGGDVITFHGDRSLNFHPDRKITGLNVIDGMIFWTDNHSEPKKINIERGKLGSLSSIYGAGFDGSQTSPDPYTWNGIGDACRGGLTMPDGSLSLACYSDFDQHTKLMVVEKHTMDCEKSTLDCDVFGCTDMTAINWNPYANTDDGSCILPLPPVYGCDNGTYGVQNSGACNSGGAYWNLNGTYFALPTGGGDGTAVTLATPNTSDYNTNDSALCIFDGTCEICDYTTGNTISDPSCSGCIDGSLAVDGSFAAMNYFAGNLDCLGLSGVDYSCCEYCTDPTALNYYAGSTNDCSGVLGGTDTNCCIVPVVGCTNPVASNYDPLATQDNGTCTFAACTFQGNECYLGQIHEGWDVAGAHGDGITEEQIDDFYRYAPLNAASSRDYWIDYHRYGGGNGLNNPSRMKTKGITYHLRFNKMHHNSSNTISRARQAFSMAWNYFQIGTIGNTTDQAWFNMYGAPTNGVENKGFNSMSPQATGFSSQIPFLDPSGDYQAGTQSATGQWSDYELVACNQNSTFEVGFNASTLRDYYRFNTRTTLINFLNYTDLYVSNDGVDQAYDQLAHDAPLSEINDWLNKETGWWAPTYIGDFNGMACAHLEVYFACSVGNPAAGAITTHSSHTDFVGGCTDPSAQNYNPAADTDDCSCSGGSGS